VAGASGGDAVVTDHAPGLERAFALEVIEQTRVPLAAVFPAYVHGSFLLNGPARFRRGAVQYRHWLDGDGMVAALTVDAGGAVFTNRFVRSVKFTREAAEQRPVFRTFGTSFPGDALKRGIGLESPVNVSVYPFGGELLAFGEQGLPWALDPATLETRGLHTFDGQLNEITPFSAHPKIDHRTGELFNFGVSFSAQHPALNLFRFAADGRLVFRRRLPLPYPSSIHDFAISPSYLAFYVSPLILRMDSLLQQGATLMDALSWEPERGSRLMIASRASGEHVATVDIGHRYCLHLVNAFERDGRLVVDVVEFEKPLYPEYQVVPDLFTDTFRGHPVRLVVDPVRGAIVDRRDIGYSCSPDFPAHDPDVVGLEYDDFWMLGISRAGRPGRKFFDHVVRVHWPTEQVETFAAPAGCYFGGEPCFVPDPAAPATRGVVVCQQFDADRVASSFLVFDAFRIAAGPIATVPLPVPIPLLFHSSFHKRDA
jgi:all-trans-8'-apo-beta-carotenal 15,15'-oxygenase